MHTIFKESLKNAIGVAKFVIAINIDVRGFSSFSKQVESPESALFIKKIFLKIINKYFNTASFFKSTGDGLIIIIDITENNLQENTQKAINQCIKIIHDFDSFCNNEPMINFNVPDKCGIGLSRGPATCLMTDEKVLDYFGDTLNIASRLMDCARPKGIVFDSKFGIDLLTKDQKKYFAKKSIYLKGVSENESLDIWYTRKTTIISEHFEKPIQEKNWHEISDSKTFKEIKQLVGNFAYKLEHKPTNINDIIIIISHSSIKNGRILKGYLSTFEFKNFEYILKADQPEISMDFNSLIEKLNKNKVKDKMLINIEIKYPEK